MTKKEKALCAVEVRQSKERVEKVIADKFKKASEIFEGIVGEGETKKVALSVQMFVSRIMANCTNFLVESYCESFSEEELDQLIALGDYRLTQGRLFDLEQKALRQVAVSILGSARDLAKESK